MADRSLKLIPLCAPPCATRAGHRIKEAADIDVCYGNLCPGKLQA